MIDTPTRMLGVDFSGAVDAGRKVWVAEGAVEGDAFVVASCRRGEELPGSGRARERCLPALVDLLAAAGEALVGLDVPFGLPAAFVAEPTWPAFALAFGGHYADAAGFRAHCRALAAGREPRRRTDVEARTPFPVANLRLHRQTFHGIRDVLAPLVAADAARVLPMQAPAAGKPSLLEICPASTLKRWRSYLPYKGRTSAHATGRARLLAVIAEQLPAVRLTGAVQAAALADAEGDALDAVLAAVTAYDLACRPVSLAALPYAEAAIEGYVFV